MSVRQNPTILFIPRWYPHPADEMFGLFVKHHAEAVSIYNQVVVLYAHPTKDGENRIQKSIENGIQVYRLMYTISSSVPGIFFNVFRYFIAVRRLLKAIKTDGHRIQVSHVHVLTRTGLIALWLRFTSEIPFIITEHWSGYLKQNQHMYKNWLKKSLAIFISRRASALTAVTRALSEGMKFHGITHKRFEIIPNVVDTSRFTIGTKTNTGKKIFLHVGCFDEKAKNVKGMLDAVKHLAHRSHEFDFRFVGTGEDFEAVKSYSRQLDLPNAVFTGLVVGEELVKEYQNADAFVLFSNYETQGVVILEAFACGTPVIATNTGGIPEVMNTERGVLVAPGDVGQLVSAMESILDSTAQFNPENARQYILDNFSNEAVGKRFSQLYLTAIKK